MYVDISYICIHIHVYIGRAGAPADRHQRHAPGDPPAAGGADVSNVGDAPRHAGGCGCVCGRGTIRVFAACCVCQCRTGCQCTHTHTHTHTHTQAHKHTHTQEATTCPPGRRQRPAATTSVTAAIGSCHAVTVGRRWRLLYACIYSDVCRQCR